MRTSVLGRSGLLGSAELPGGRRLWAFLPLVSFFLISVPSSLHGQESTQQDQPAPESVEELGGPLERAFRERLRAKTLFPRLRRQLDKMPPFFQDTEVVVHPRTFYFYRRNLDGSRSEAWAAGGSVAYRSGWLLDHFAIGAEYYTSQKLEGDPGKDGTGLLKPGQHGYDVLGQLYAQARYQNHSLKLYRQELNLPYVNKNDSRMTPNTFEAYTLRGLSNDVPWFGQIDYIAGYVDKMKPRNADSFISMSDAAGVSGKDDGMALGGFRVRPSDAFTFGAIDYFVDDVINIAYSEAGYTWKINEHAGLSFQAQFTDQRSVGEDRLTAQPFDTRVWGGRVSASYRNTVLSLAVSSTDQEEKIRTPYGSYPGYLSLMQSDFNRAGEDAWLAGISYNFRRFGLEELSFFANYAEGYNALDPESRASLGNQREGNLTLDYQIEQGPLRGLWFRLRGSLLEVAGEDHLSEELRAMVYYSARIL